MVLFLSPFFVAKITFALWRDSLAPPSSCTQTHPCLLPHRLLPDLCQRLFLNTERHHSVCPCFQCLPFNPAQQTRHRLSGGGGAVNHVMPWLGTSWLDFLFDSHFTYISKVRGFCLSFLRLYSNYFISPCLFQIHSLQIHSLLSLIVITYICICVCVHITGIF